MLHITQLKPGDELKCTMRLGFAIKSEVNQRTKEVYRVVPYRAQKAGSDDWTGFFAFVLFNDTERKILRIQTTPIGTWGRPQSTGNDVVEVPYNIFRRVQLISKTTYPAKGRKPNRPTSYSPLGHMDYRPYHTLTEVSLV